MNYIMPSNWKGWWAVGIIAVLALIAGWANGTHKMIRSGAWVLIALVAGVAAFNEVTKGK